MLDSVTLLHLGWLWLLSYLWWIFIVIADTAAGPALVMKKPYFQNFFGQSFARWPGHEDWLDNVKLKWTLRLDLPLFSKTFLCWILPHFYIWVDYHCFHVWISEYSLLKILLLVFYSCSSLLWCAWSDTWEWRLPGCGANILTNDL